MKSEREKMLLRSNSDAIDEKIDKANVDIEEEKQQAFVNLIIKIIVSKTIKDYYEKGN